jgi:hypothetical protein
MRFLKDITVPFLHMARLALVKLTPWKEVGAEKSR